MSDKIEITCPTCKTSWEKTLRDLEQLETIFKGHASNKSTKNIVKYRAVCPVDGTYVILEVQED